MGIREGKGREVGGRAGYGSSSVDSSGSWPIARRILRFARCWSRTARASVSKPMVGREAAAASSSLSVASSMSSRRRSRACSSASVSLRRERLGFFLGGGDAIPSSESAARPLPFSRLRDSSARRSNSSRLACSRRFSSRTMSSRRYGSGNVPGLSRLLASRAHGTNCAGARGRPGRSEGRERTSRCSGLRSGRNTRSFPSDSTSEPSRCGMSATAGQISAQYESEESTRPMWDGCGRDEGPASTSG